MAFIELKNCSKKYGSGSTVVWANKNISFDIKQGELVIILGSSGAGKSTLLNILGGMENVTEGEVIINGNNIAKYSAKELTKYRRNEIGFVFQFYNLIPNLTVKENVELANELVTNPIDAEGALKEVGLEKRINNFPSQLSGGEQQRVAIARAIAKNPSLLLCDEPTGALDYQTGKKVLKILQDRSLKKNSTVVIVTHNAALAPIADKVIRIQDGKVKQIENNSSPQDIAQIEWWVSEMNRRILWKDALSSLNHSWGRFIGILLLMAVSAFAFIGLKMAGPDMRNTAQTYYQDVNLADLTVSSNYGLDKNDTQTIKNQAKKATIDFGYLQDTTINNSKTSLRVLSESKNISTSQLISGNFPKKDNQIVLSYLLRNKYHIGEWITLNEHSNLKNSRFKIVGFIRPSEYTDKSNLGQTNVGTGQLSGVAIVKKSAFKAQSYSIARIRFNKTKKLDPYSSTYQKFIDNKKERLTNSLAQNSKLKKTEVDNNFKDAQKQIKQAKKQIQLAENNGLEITKEKEKLEKQQKKLNEQEQEIKQLGSISYYVNDRKNDSGYDTYQSNSEKIELITNIFPVFLFAVAALVSFSTMTRFIDEERQNIGVLRALGYSKLDTSLKFVIYSLTAALTGVFIGAIGGYWILPRIIFNAYTANLTLTNFQSGFSWKYLFLTFLISILCTTGAAVIQLFIVLRAKTSELLLPKPPKNGSRILLEKIKPFWQHLSFNYKVTLRNIFRYKVKMIMTILGIAGCTGLLMMGSGIRDSLARIGQKQYSEIIKYDLIAIDKNSLSSEQSTKLNQKLSSSQVNKYLPVYF